MKVKLNTPIATSKMSIPMGAIVNMPQADAERMIERGIAVKSVTKEAAAVDLDVAEKRAATSVED